MGGVNSMAQELMLYDEWQVVGRAEHFSKIVRDRQGYLGEESVVPLDSNHSEEEQLELYCYRRSQNIGLVQVYGAQIMSMNVGICTIAKSVKVVTQYLPKRLSTIPRFSFPQALYVLTEVLKGFREISRRFGAIYIDNEMIAFTQSGRARCWNNPNFAINHPRESMYEHTGRIGEAAMVTEILNLVEERTQGGRFPNNFNRIFSYQSYMDFPTAQRIVEDYAEDNQIAIPDRINMARNRALELELPPHQQHSRLQPGLPPTKTTTTTTTIVQEAPPIVQPTAGYGLPLISQQSMLQAPYQVQQQYLPANYGGQSQLVYY